MNRLRPHRGRSRGLSLIELLIGVAIGLAVIAGALKFFASHLDTNRRLLMDARLQQDLRAAGDLIARDLRRAGYWKGAVAGLSYPPRLNPYRAIAPGSAAAGMALYSYSRDSSENDTVDSNESFGIRISGGALQLLEGAGGWQQLTDPGSVLITRLVVTPVVRTLPLGHLCTPACDSAEPLCPRLNVRRYEVVLRGRSTLDAGVVREIRESVRVRNDELPAVGCPGAAP